MKRLAIVTLLLCALPARANDSAFSGVGGTMKPMKGQHSSVRMEREKIVVDAYPKHYVTTVDFVFHNLGHKNVATMGFPEGNYGDVANYKSKSAFLQFKTWVDGVPFKATRRSRRSGGDWEYNAYWTKTVPFARGQKRHVRVKYSSPYGGTAMLGLTRAIRYNFTGGNWKNDVVRSDMEVRVHTPGRWLMMSSWYQGENEAVSLPWTLRGNVFSRSWSQWEAEGNMVIRLVPSQAGWLLSKELATQSGSYSKSVQAATEFTIPGRMPHNQEPFQGAPVTGFLRDGVGFLSLDAVKNALFTSSEKVGDYATLSKLIRTEWDAKTRDRTLYAGNTKLIWREGVGEVTVNGYKRHVLKAAPFVFNNTLYLPAADVAQLLGGTVRINAGQHWIDAKFPPIDLRPRRFQQPRPLPQETK